MNKEDADEYSGREASLAYLASKRNGETAPRTAPNIIKKMLSRGVRFAEPASTAGALAVADPCV